MSRERGKKKEGEKEKDLAERIRVEVGEETSTVYLLTEGKCREDRPCTAPTSICLVIVYRYGERNEW